MPKQTDASLQRISAVGFRQEMNEAMGVHKRTDRGVNPDKTRNRKTIKCRKDGVVFWGNGLVGYIESEKATVYI